MPIERTTELLIIKNNGRILNDTRKKSHIPITYLIFAWGLSRTKFLELKAWKLNVTKNFFLQLSIIKTLKGLKQKLKMVLECMSIYFFYQF